MRREKTERLKKERVEFLERFQNEIDKIMDELEVKESDFAGLEVDMQNCEDAEIWNLYYTDILRLEDAWDILVDVEADIIGLKEKKEKETGDGQRDA